MRLLDRTAQTNRWRHRPTAEKLLIAQLAMGLALISRSVVVEAAVLVLMVALARIGAGIALPTLFRAAIVPTGFILTGLLAQIVAVDFSSSLPRLALVGPAQLAEAGFFLLRGMAALSGLLFLALTTPLNRIIAFLESLTDESFLTNPATSDPWPEGHPAVAKRIMP